MPPADGKVRKRSDGKTCNNSSGSGSLAPQPAAVAAEAAAVATAAAAAAVAAEAVATEQSAPVRGKEGSPVAMDEAATAEKTSLSAYSSSDSEDEKAKKRRQSPSKSRSPSPEKVPVPPSLPTPAPPAALSDSDRAELEELRQWRKSLADVSAKTTDGSSSPAQTIDKPRSRSPEHIPLYK